MVKTHAKKINDSQLQVRQNNFFSFKEFKLQINFGHQLKQSVWLCPVSIKLKPDCRVNNIGVICTKVLSRGKQLTVTQSKSKTIITRSMLTISLIVFTDKLQGHVNTFYSK